MVTTLIRTQFSCGFFLPISISCEGKERDMEAPLFQEIDALKAAYKWAHLVILFGKLVQGRGTERNLEVDSHIPVDVSVILCQSLCNLRRA